MQSASGVGQNSGVTCLPFGEAAPFPGAISVSADGHTAVHISLSNDVVLWDMVSNSTLETIPSDGKKPRAVALSSDGRLLAIGYLDSRVIVMSRNEHKILRELNGHVGAVSALAFSPDGKMLASGGNDATTQIWEVSTGRRLHIFDSQFGGAVASIGFTGDGQALAVNEWYAFQYEVIRGTTLWDIKEGIEISTRDVTPPNSDSTMRAGQALGGNGWLLTYTGDKGLMVERLDLCAAPQQMPSGGYAETVAADPLGHWVAAAEDDKLTIFGVNDKTKSYSITLPSKAIALAVQADGKSIVALMSARTRAKGNYDPRAGRDDATGTGGVLYRIPVPESLWNLPPVVVKENATHCPAKESVRAVQDFKFPEKPDELKVTANLVATKEMLVPVKRIDVDNTGKELEINTTRELYFGRDQSIYALYTAPEWQIGVAVWDLHTQRLLRSRFEWFDVDWNYSNPTHRLRDGWGVSDKSLIDLLTGKPFSSINVSDEGDPNKSSVTGTSDPDTGEIYRAMSGHFERYAADGQRMKDIKTSGIVTAYSARNGRLAALYSNGKIQVWSLQAGEESKTYMLLPHQDENSPCGEKFELSADGNYVQVSCDQGPDAPTEYMIYRIKSAKLIAEGSWLIPFLGRANIGVAEDARQYHLAVWDFDHGKIIARLPRHPSHDKNGAYKPPVVAMSDDGRLLASASNDGLVRVWDIQTRQLLGEASLEKEVTALAFDSTAQRLAAGRVDGQLFVLQIPELK